MYGCEETKQLRYLINCSCGHSVEAHAAGRCEGAGGRRCTCAVGESAALERAMESAKREGFTAFRAADRERAGWKARAG